jgi:hypothetical protein
MCKIELATKTMTAESRIGSHSDTIVTIGESSYKYYILRVMAEHFSSQAMIIFLFSNNIDFTEDPIRHEMLCRAFPAV